jgi:DNA-binding NarL/FixJ family response regulator
MNKIKIAIADDYQVFREGLIITLTYDDDMEVIIEAENGEVLLEKMKTITPDLVIMDFKMPVMDGMKATRIIKELYPSVKVLVISMYEDEKFIQSFKECGADGYLLKNAEPDEIRQLVYDIIKKQGH